MTIEEREKDFRDKVNLLIEFPYEMRQQFISYWSEPSARGKMRFEYEKTWDLKRRLHRWAGQQQFKIGDKNYRPSETPLKATEMVLTGPPELQELDMLLNRFRLHPTDVSFIGLAKYYPYMKENGLLKKFDAAEVRLIQDSYKGDNAKCRSACVLETLKFYGNKGWTFQMTMELRKKLMV